MNQHQEEVQDSEVQEPLIANCISFNGTITTDLIQLEENKFGFVLRGPNNEEFPLIILNTTKEELGNSLMKNDRISSIGELKKRNNEWVIEASQIYRIPIKN